MIDKNTVRDINTSKGHEITQKILRETINPIVRNAMKNNESMFYGVAQNLSENENGFRLHTEIETAIREYENPIDDRAKKAGENAIHHLLCYALRDDTVTLYNMLRKNTSHELPSVYENYVIETILLVAGYNSDNYWHVFNDLAYQLRNADKQINTSILKASNLNESIKLLEHKVTKNVKPVLQVPLDKIDKLTSLLENGDVLKYAPDKYAGYYLRNEHMHFDEKVGFIEQGREFESISVPKSVVGLLNPMYFARKFMEKGLTTESFLAQCTN